MNYLMKHMDLSKITTYQAGIVQAAANRLLQKHCDEILEPYGITKMQWIIIGATLDYGKNGVRISDLAKKLGTTLPYMTKLIKPLQIKGILQVNVNEKDNRSKIVIVAPEFAKKCPEIEQTLRDGLRNSIYANTNPGEFQTYIKVLYELAAIN